MEPTRNGLVLLLSVISLFLACATAVTLAKLPQEERDRIQTRKFDAPDTLIYSAVLNTLMDKGYPIQVSDRASGLIQTEPSTGPCLGYEYLSSEGYKATSDVATGCLAGGGGIHLSYRSRVTARVKEAVVRLSIIWERCNVQGTSLLPAQSAYEAFDADTATARRAYDTLFVSVSRRLNP